MSDIVKDLNYWKNNCEAEYLHTPICVLAYITELEKSNKELLEKLSALVELQKEHYGSGMNTHLALITFSKECEALINKHSTNEAKI